MLCDLALSHAVPGQPPSAPSPTPEPGAWQAGGSSSPPAPVWDVAVGPWASARGGAGQEVGMGLLPFRYSSSFQPPSPFRISSLAGKALGTLLCLSIWASALCTLRRGAVGMFLPPARCFFWLGPRPPAWCHFPAPCRQGSCGFHQSGHTGEISVPQCWDLI